MPLTKSLIEPGWWVFLVVFCTIAAGYSAEAERDEDAQRSKALRIARAHLDTKILGTRGGSSKWALDAKRKGNGWVVSIPEDVVRTMPGGFPQWLLVDVEKNAVVVFNPQAEAAGQKALRHLVVSLQIKPEKLRVGNSVTLRAVVKNEGKKADRLVRLRAGELENYAKFHGWRIRVEGPGGKYIFIPIPEPPPALRDGDLTELRPGEWFGVAVNLSDMALIKDDPPYKRLAQTAGTYSVALTYEGSKESFGSYFIKSDVKDVFLGPLRSDVLEFNIEKGQ